MDNIEHRTMPYFQNIFRNKTYGKSITQTLREDQDKVDALFNKINLIKTEQLIKDICKQVVHGRS